MRTIGTIDLTQKTQNDTAIRHNSVGTIVPVVPIVGSAFKSGRAAAARWRERVGRRPPRGEGRDRRRVNDALRASQ